MHVTDEIKQIFESAGVTGSLYARQIPDPRIPPSDHLCPSEVSVGGDEPVVLASVFKIVVAVAYARAVAQGQLDPHERVRIGRRDRLGGIATGGCADDVEMSWRDCALFMMTMSDNAATDVLGRGLGLEAIRDVLRSAGLTQTRIEGWCEDIFNDMAEDLGVGSVADNLENYLAAFHTPAIENLRALDPRRCRQASTPREVADLLTQIWSDQIAAPEACAEVRALMSRQVWDQRLSSGFDDDVRVAGKTGTLPKLRNEAGVITYPDGSSYAVAVFLRLPAYVERHHQADHAIGAAAAAAVSSLRTRS